MGASTRFRVRGRVWVDGPAGTYLGYGRAVLLERIREYGSISAAARSMSMSYRHAWELVNSVNRQAAHPLVETVNGGKGGGGAHLTPAGEHAIAAFWTLQADLARLLEAKTAEWDAQADRAAPSGTAAPGERHPR